VSKNDEGRDEARTEMARDELLVIAGARLGGLAKADVELIASLDAETATVVHDELVRARTEVEARELFNRFIVKRR